MLTLHGPGNCEPRRPAVLHEVKKNTPNKGKLFWTCPAHPYCDFFLWRDDARLREEGLPAGTDAAAATADARLQPPPGPQTPTFVQRRLTSFGIQVTPGRRHRGPRTGADRPHDLSSTGGDAESPGAADTPSRRPALEEASCRIETPGAAASDAAGAADVGTPCPTASKRKLDAFQHDGGGGGGDAWLSDLASDDERLLADLADRSAQGASGRARDAFATPAADRSAAAPPSVSHVARTLFTAPVAKRQKTASFEAPTPFAAGMPTPAKTPTTSTASDDGPPSAPSSSPPDPPALDPADQVMPLLRGQNVDASLLQSVGELLAASARRTRGLVMSRDSVRTTLRQREDRIARLQERVAALEDKEAFYSKQLTNIKGQLMKMYEDN